MKRYPIHGRRLAYGIAHTTLSGSALDARHIPKPSRWWRWLVVAGVPGVALAVLAFDWARWLAS